MIRGITVKTIKIMFIVTLFLTLCVFSGLVSALDQSAISAFPVLSKQVVNIGNSVTVRITVQSNAAQDLQLLHVGVNFDWMDSGLFFGPNNPVTLAANGSYTTPPFIVQIPTNVTVGTHTYFVGVDGTEGTDQTEFYWNSTTSIIQVLPANTTGSTPTITVSPTGGGGGQTTSSPLTLILYFAVAAIVVVVVIAVIVLLIQRKRKQKPQETSTPETPAAPVTDEPKKPAEEENYSI